MAAGSRYSEDFNLLPWGAISAHTESDYVLTTFSAGYSERDPTLVEQYLPYQRKPLYGSGATGEYAESGTDSLKKERELIGSALFDFGNAATHVEISATGGQIFDGLAWLPENLTDSLGNVTLFRPHNQDMSFFTVSLIPEFRIWRLFSIRVGGAYHYLDYELTDKMPFSPEYQLFAGGELHVYWRQRLAHFYAYSEIVYSGSYDGYVHEKLGENPVVNAVLALGLKDFEMHFVFQNVFARIYEPREGWTFPGRYVYYGIEWHFLD
jgi:hypothetical protein